MEKKTTVVETTFEDDLNQNHDQMDIVERIDDFFRDMPGGYTISVYRDQPKEFSGFLEEIPIEDDEKPIDIEYLKRTWGGKLLRLLIRSSDGIFRKRILIPLKSFPPMIYGRTINHNPFGAEDDKKEKENPLEIFKAMNDMVRTQSGNGVDTTSQVLVPIITALLQQRMEYAPPPPTTPLSGITEIMQGLEAMRAFVTPPSQSSDSGEGDMVASILKIGESFLTSRQQQPFQKTPLIAPVTIPNIPQLPQADEKKEEKIDLAGINPAKLMKIMSSLTGQDAAGLFFQTVQAMPPSEQEAAIRAIMSGLGVEEIDDEDENSPKEIQGSAIDHEGDGARNRPVD